MSTVPIESDVPTPFFADTRTLAQKLQVTKRDWIPTKNADDPKMIFGLVIERSSYVGKNDTHPTARVLTADNIEWGVIAFHGYLHREFDSKKPRVGDFVAIGYTGTKPAKKAGDSDAFVYVMEVDRNPEMPLDLESATATDEPTDELPSPSTEDASSAEPGAAAQTENADFAAGADDDIPF